jgi:hypothetical protein
VEGSKKALVCVVEDGKRLCAVRVRLVELDRVVDDGVCLEMLFQVWSGVARVMAGGGAGLTDKTLDCGVSPFVSGASPLLMVPLVVVVVSSACGDMRV